MPSVRAPEADDDKPGFNDEKFVECFETTVSFLKKARLRIKKRNNEQARRASLRTQLREPHKLPPPEFGDFMKRYKTLLPMNKVGRSAENLHSAPKRDTRLTDSRFLSSYGRVATDIASTGARVNVDQDKMQHFQDVLQYHQRAIEKQEQDLQMEEEKARAQRLREREEAKNMSLDISLARSRQLRRDRFIRNKLGRQAAKEILKTEWSESELQQSRGSAGPGFPEYPQSPQVQALFDRDRQPSFQPLSGMIQRPPIISSSMPNLSSVNVQPQSSTWRPEKREKHLPLLESSIEFVRCD